MKFKKIYTLGLGLLIAGMSAVNAQTQDNEKIFYRMDRVKANNPWTKSLNYAGLTFNENQDFTIVEIDFQYGKGSFRNVNAPTASNKTNLQTESFRRLNKVFFYGKFSFDYMNRLKMGWCNVSTRIALQYSLQTACRDVRPWKLTFWKAASAT